MDAHAEGAPSGLGVSRGRHGQAVSEGAADPEAAGPEPPLDPRFLRRRRAVHGVELLLGDDAAVVEGAGRGDGGEEGVEARLVPELQPDHDPHREAGGGGADGRGSEGESRQHDRGSPLRRSSRSDQAERLSRS